MACLQIYRELLSLVTFLRVHSNSEDVSYLSRQNTYPNLKTTCHIKLKFFLSTKLVENLFLAKCLISVAAPLTHWSYCKCKDVLQTLIVHKIPAKKHQVVDGWAADEISVLEILFWKYLEYVPLILRKYSPSIETHLAVVRGLSTNKFQTECFNEKSSTERRS